MVVPTGDWSSLEYLFWTGVVSHNKKVPRIHDVTELMLSCAEIDCDFNKILDFGDKLTSYSVATRYPDDWREISLEEANEAVLDAQKVLDFVKSKIEMEI